MSKAIQFKNKSGEKIYPCHVRPHKRQENQPGSGGRCQQGSGGAEG